MEPSKSKRPTRNSKNYIFTNKTFSQKAIMSVILGIIGIASIIVAVAFTYSKGGIATLEYGGVVLLSLIYGFAGLVLAIISKKEPDKYYFISYLGMVLNAIVIAMVSLILYAGAYGL